MTKEIMTAITMTIVFKVIDRTLGLRVSEEEEIIGLDATEHGLSFRLCRIQFNGCYRWRYECK